MRLKLSAKVTIPATWMDLEIVALSEVRQRKTSICDAAYIRNLKKGYKQIYLQNRNRVTDVENKFMVTRGKVGGGANWEVRTDIYIHCCR